MIDKTKLTDGAFYWVKWKKDAQWEIVKYRQDDDIFKFTNGSHQDTNSTFEVDLTPVTYPTKDTSVTIGVGNGHGNHFVHGDYDSIKLLQEKLLDYEKVRTENMRYHNMSMFNNTSSIH